VDTIREGTAPAIIRRKGAEGNLPVSLEERIEALVILCGDREEGIRQRALETLQGWNPQELRGILANPATPVAVLDFAANRLASERTELLEALLENSSLPDDLRGEMEARLLAAALESIGTAALPGQAPPIAQTATAETPQRQTLIQKVDRMSTVEKIKAALMGNQEMRMILIRDSNKLVSRAVLQSPKLSDTEIEAYASAKNVSEEVLRLIAANRAFMKTYAVVRALINNPRAPIDITLPLMNRLYEKDLKFLTVNRNVPDVIRGTAIKLLQQKADAAKPKFSFRKH
jgi:hypothetical protein